MITRAFAKINLGLRVLGKRQDGYHDLATVFHQIDMFDELDVRLHEHDIKLSTNLSDLPTDGSNLCVRAAHLLRDLTGSPDGVDINLRKNIPIGAGLGGGSADAAATLKALVQLWNLDIAPSELQSLALTIGSDVPFFLNGGTAYATGRGELLEPIALNLPYWIIVVTPPVHVSTAWAYKNLKRREPAIGTDLRMVLKENLHNPEILSKSLTNDFEDVVFETHPEIRAVKEALLNNGADVALLSGSGASVFGLVRSESTAKNLLSLLPPFGRVSSTRPGFAPALSAAPPPQANGRGML